MNKRLVLVDGYNLIRNDPMLSVIEARSLEAGRRALISRMLTSFNLQANEITIVFDGSNAPMPVPASERHGQVRVIFSRQGETADAVILRMIAAAPPSQQIALLSDDNELRNAVQARAGIAGGAANRARPRAGAVFVHGQGQRRPAQDRREEGEPSAGQEKIAPDVADPLVTLDSRARDVG